MPVQGSYDVTAMCLRATGLRFFQIGHCAELNKIVEATMPVNPYDDRKVSLRRPHRNGGLDIVRASYTRRKANVTEALRCFFPHENVGSAQWTLHRAEGFLPTTIKSQAVKIVITWSIIPDENNNIGLVYSSESSATGSMGLD